MVQLAAGLDLLSSPMGGHEPNITDNGTTTTVAFLGTFGQADKSGFERAMAAASQLGKGVIVDLSRCLGCDSAAIMLMLNYKRSFAERLQIVVPESGAVRRVLEVSGLVRKLAVTASMEHALRLLPG